MIYLISQKGALTTLLPLPWASAEAVQLQVNLVMTLCKAVIESVALRPMVKKMMNRWQRAPAFLKKLMLIQNAHINAKLPSHRESPVALHLCQLIKRLCFFRKYFLPPQLEIPEHSMNSECPFPLTPGSALFQCELWPQGMQRSPPLSNPCITWRALLLVVSGRYQLLEKSCKKLSWRELDG